MSDEDEKAREDGSYALQFVKIEEDGTVRDLDPNEMEYLNTKFHPADGDRPYIKQTYEQRNALGKVMGFLPRAALPPDVPVISLETQPVLTSEAAIEAARETFRSVAGITGPFAAALSRGIWQVSAQSEYGQTFLVKVSTTGRVAFGGLG